MPKPNRSILPVRPRRLRAQPQLREMLHRVAVRRRDLVLPVFVKAFLRAGFAEFTAPIPVAATRPIAVVPSPLVPSAPKIYRVQAASPGLALLAQVDRGGGDGAQIQVVVGDIVPDYGRVKSIAQKGTVWVVTTEHGAIQ